MKVSILVPIYSVADFIERCARSLFEQTYSDIEFVFVDDASPDNSIGLLNSLVNHYPTIIDRIRIIRHPVNRGLSAARNTAIENCTGDFVLHVDSDDYLELDAVERLVALQMQTDADIVSGDAIRHTQSGDIPYDEPDYSDKYQMLQNLTSSFYHHTIWGRLIRRNLYVEHGILAEEGCNVGEDWQVLVPLVYYSNRIAHLRYPIYHYNCTNQVSYMAQKESSVLNDSIARQDFRSLEIVKCFVEDKNKHLYSLIKIAGRFFAHSIMDECVLQGNASLFGFISRKLDADKDGYDRNPMARIIDRSFLLYWVKVRIRRFFQS